MATDSNVWLILGVFTLAIVSPGPNFILVVNSAASESRRRAQFTALGIACGSGLFAAAGLLGLLVLVTSLPHFSGLVRIVGSSYLVWLGLNLIWKALRSSATLQGRKTPGAPEASRAFRTGLLTNLTNPKAWAFYLSLFTLIVSPGYSLASKLLLTMTMFLISWGWYSLVVFLVASPRIQPLFRRIQRWIEGFLGLTLVGLGGRILCNR